MKFKHLILTLFFSSFLFTGCKFEENTRTELYEDFKGEIKWDPSTFKKVPEKAPFEMSLKIENINESSSQSLSLQLMLVNSSQDSIFLGAIAGESPYFDFVVTRLDSLRVWSRIQTNMRGLKLETISLGPLDTVSYKDSWDYKDYNGETLKNGKYLIYGGIEQLTLWDDEDYQKVVSEYGTIGVGPDTLNIE